MSRSGVVASIFAVEGEYRYLGSPVGFVIPITLTHPHKFYPVGRRGSLVSTAIAEPWQSNMRKMIALAILAVALIAGRAAVMKTIHPQHAVACAAYRC